MCQERL
ncbi:hypothetical protein E2C01_099015 [Portunus trituberculatus]|nr:hypothetical protein [Portunus trituberculatus]